MQAVDLEGLKLDTVSLHRGRLICNLLRREGILLENSHFLIGLADVLLESYARRAPGA
jgi:hypothetical protein